MLDHLQACPYCPKYNAALRPPCSIHNDISWVNRHGGCGMFPDRGESDLNVKKRAGQQKQKHQDRSYTSKNDGRPKFVS